jgi:hypothetical protein
MNVSDVYVASEADDPRIESPGKSRVRDVMPRGDTIAVGTELSLGGCTAECKESCSGMCCCEV